MGETATKGPVRFIFVGINVGKATRRPYGCAATHQLVEISVETVILLRPGKPGTRERNCLVNFPPVPVPTLETPGH
jgi:hypothetical protein